MGEQRSDITLEGAGTTSSKAGWSKKYFLVPGCFSLLDS